VEQQFRAPVSHRELPCGLGMARIRTGRAMTAKIKRLSIALKRDCESMISRNYSFVLYMYIRVAHTRRISARSEPDTGCLMNHRSRRSSTGGKRPKGIESASFSMIK